jgi:aspartyl-tRNA(Asn)/glutamyl-tRNA(Gln) amidotransferase subunit A
MIYGSLGSDTGGSIRIPAALCGVTGLKPTFGRVSRHGAMPRVWSQDSIGPIARSADDCALILSAVAGPDGLDPLVVGEVPRFEWPSPTVDRCARIGVLEIIDEANRDVERCVEQATADLRRGGHAIETATWTNISDVIALAETVHKVEATTIHDTFLREQPESYSAFLRERLEDGLMIPAVRYLQALSLRTLMARDFVENVLRDFDAVVLPTVGSQAPLASEFGENSDDNWRMLRKLTYFTRPFSYLGLPALTVPCGFGDGGMPVGLQIIGRPFDEATILSVGHTYQRATDWHNKCPSLSA